MLISFLIAYIAARKSPAALAAVTPASAAKPVPASLPAVNVLLLLQAENRELAERLVMLERIAPAVPDCPLAAEIAANARRTLGA